MTRKEYIAQRLVEGCDFGDWFSLSYETQQFRALESKSDTVWVNLKSGARVTISVPNKRLREVTISRPRRDGTVRKTRKEMHYFVYDYAPLV